MQCLLSALERQDGKEAAQGILMVEMEVAFGEGRRE